MWVQNNRFQQPGSNLIEGTAMGWCAQVQRQLQQEVPYELALPREYEPGYAYPLIIFFHDDGGNEQHLHRWMPHISGQNFIGLGLRAPLLDSSMLPGRYRWPGRRRPLYQQLQSIVDGLNTDWNINPRRIVLMGEGTGASLAMRIWLRYRHSFAGAIALRPSKNWEHKLPPLAADLEGRLLLGGLDFEDPATAAALDGLCEAGIDVRTLTAATTDHAAIGQGINHWMMSGISTTIW